MLKIDLSDLMLIVAIALIITGCCFISWAVTMVAVGALLIGAALLVEKAALIKRQAQSQAQSQPH
jgi:hypothetical protein